MELDAFNFDDFLGERWNFSDFLKKQGLYFPIQSGKIDSTSGIILEGSTREFLRRVDQNSRLLGMPGIISDAKLIEYELSDEINSKTRIWWAAPSEIEVDISIPVTNYSAAKTFIEDVRYYAEIQGMKW